MNMNVEKFSKILSSESVIVCGLKVKLVTYDKNYYRYASPNVFYLEESLKELYDKTGIDSFEKLKRHVGILDSSRRNIDSFNGPIVPLPIDIEWYHTISGELEKLPEFEYSPESEHYANICNWIGNMAIQDIPFIEKGRSGVMDCHGNILLPALFDECNPTDEPSLLIPVKNSGKWGLAMRDGSNIDKIDFIYDEVASWANFFIVHNIDKVGIIGPSGKLIIPVEMDDLTFVSLAGIVVTKKNNKYGFRFNNRIYIEPIVDEIILPIQKKRGRENDSVRFRIDNEWFFLTYEGEWTDSDSGNTIKDYDLDMNSLINNRTI